MTRDRDFAEILAQLRNRHANPAASEDAATYVYERFADHVRKLARKKLGHSLRERIDADDIVVEVFAEFFRLVDAGHFPRLESWDDLWDVLAKITIAECRDAFRRCTSLKRGGGRVEGDEALALQSREETPEEAAMVVDLLEQLRSRLSESEMQIVMLRMDGYSSKEIASRLGIVERTIQRKLRGIRKKWESLIEVEPTRPQEPTSSRGPEGPTPGRPEFVRRHTDISFPAQVRVGKTHNLRVQIVPAEVTLPTGEVKELPKPHPHDATMTLKAVLPVSISVAAENFEIEGDTRVDIVVPVTGKSTAVTFALRGREIGPARIMVDFAQEGRPVGSVDLYPKVVAADQREVDKQALTEGEVRLAVIPGPPPDVTIKIFEHRASGQPGQLHFVLSSTHPNLRDLPVMDGDLGILDLKSETAAWVENQLRPLSRLADRSDATVEQVRKTLCSIGFNFYEQLLPPMLKELCWTFRARGVRTLLVLSDDPHIPWELIKPYRVNFATGQLEADDIFWGEAFALTHWLRGRPPVPRFSFKRVLAMAAGATVPHSTEAETRRDVGVIASGQVQQSEFAELPADASLRSAAAELGVLHSLKKTGASVRVLPARRHDLEEALERGGFDLLHLACHGAFGGTQAADASVVLMEDGTFSAAELSQRMAGLRRTSPLVFFNACRSGRVSFSLTRLGSWGARLVQLGCGGFVGSLWSVSDKAALAFAEAFYELMSQGMSIGDAMVEARLRIRCQYPNDPTWLAYRCYADPMARME